MSAATSCSVGVYLLSTGLVCLLACLIGWNRPSSPSYSNTAPNPQALASVHKKNSLDKSGGISTGAVTNIVLSVWNASSHSAFHSNITVFPVYGRDARVHSLDIYQLVSLLPVLETEYYMQRSYSQRSSMLDS